MSNDMIDTKHERMRERLRSAFLAALCSAHHVRCPLVAETDDAASLKEALGEWSEIVGDGFDVDPLDADHALAAIGLAHGLAGNGRALQVLKKRKGLLVVVTPTSDLEETLREDLPHLLRAAGKAKEEKGRNLFEFLSGVHRSQTVLDRVRNGKMLIEITPSLRSLDRSLRRIATVIELPRMSGALLGELVHVMSGDVPNRTISDRDARYLELSDLIYSLRDDRSADERIEVLQTLINDRRTNEQDGPTLQQMHGYGTAKAWGLEMVQDLDDYALGRIEWLDIDRRSLLLSGPPGVGKTEYAKALARTAQLPLVSTSVAEWNSASHLGSTLKAIENSFAAARDKAPCILFIDELDGLSNRSDAETRYREYWTQIVNQVLTNLGDERALEGVVVIAASNHPERIDPAVLRSGRISDHIRIDLPDVRDRTAILYDYLGDDAGAVDVQAIAGIMHGASGADIAHAVRQARSAARRKRLDLDTSVMLGIVGKVPDDMPSDVRWLVAVHEAGHAVVGHLLGLEMAGATLVGYGGWTSFTRPIEGTTLRKIEHKLAMFLAGRAAESVLLGATTTGNQADLEAATRLASFAVGECSLADGEIVHVPALPGHARVLAETRLGQQVRAMLSAAEAEATAIIEQHREAIIALAERLVEKGFVGRDDVLAVMSDAAAQLEIEGTSRRLPKPNGQADMEAVA